MLQIILITAIVFVIIQIVMTYKLFGLDNVCGKKYIQCFVKCMHCSFVVVSLYDNCFMHVLALQNRSV